ncbi:MAG: right-handed parallel beta-helix repeat-containing protein [Candidatus Symbiothrix sp.]|nr:right-handed parallel beta-helix repeat-containing protein [Candidatus Symbiothrix sp.]
MNEIKYYVSSANGSDKNEGSFHKPFATPEQAVKAIKSNTKNNAFTIYFREGVYYRNSSLDIPENISLKLTAYDNEQVVFYGGKKLSGKKFKPCKETSILKRLLPGVKDKIRVIDLKKEGVSDFGTLKQHGFGIIPEPAPLELFIDNEPMMLARYPNTGILEIGEVHDKGSVPRDGDFSNRGAEFGYEYNRPERWKNAGEIWLHGKFSFGYNDDHLKVEHINHTKNSIKVVQPHIYGVRSSSSDKNKALSIRGYYAYNLLEEIDMPKEYFLDRKNGKLYIYPDQDIEKSDVEISLIESSLVRIRNTSQVTITGIHFTCARGMAVFIDNSTDIVIDNCRFSNLGTVAISMGYVLQNNKMEYYADGSPRMDPEITGDFRNIVISNCRIRNTGTGGIIVNGGNRKSLTPGNNLIHNCEFTKNDRINNTYSPSIKLMGIGNIVRNCNFYDLHHQAISFMGNDHLIEYCRFDDVCKNADDMGAVYTGRDPSSRGTVIQYNYFSNILPKNDLVSICGVYIDDGSGGIIIRNNLFHKVGNPGHYGNFAAVFFHGGHDNEIIDNIFFDCKVAIGHGAWNDKRWSDFLSSPIMNSRLKDEVDILSPLYQEKYPALTGYFTDFGRRLNYVRNNLFIRSESLRFGDFLLRSNGLFKTTAGDPQLLDYDEIKREFPFVNPFPYNTTGTIKKNEQ